MDLYDFSSFKLSQAQEVVELFADVFTVSEGKIEGQVIKNLVFDLIETTKSQDLLGFVAYLDKKIVASIFFSRFIVPNGKKSFILSPVAVATKEHGKGIGQKLINHGIDYLKSINVQLLFTYGDPQFYSRVGFNVLNENIIKAPQKLSHPEGWLVQSLDGHPVKSVNGQTQCVDALNKPEYW